MNASPPPPAGRAARFGTALAFAYPIAAHVAVLSGRPRWIAASALVLVVAVLFDPLRRRRLWAWSLLAVIGAGLWRLGQGEHATLPLFAAPVLIPGAIAWLFGRTLRPGSTPLIEQVAQAMENTADLGAAERAYARTLTAVWALLTGALALVSLVLALLARPKGLLLAFGIEPPVSVPLATWSLFANVVSYAVLGVMFAAEFAYRGYRFPGQRQRSFLTFIRGIARLGHLFGARRGS